VKLRIVAQAEAEIESARRYLNGQSPLLGERFLDDLAAAFGAIAESPLNCSRVETLGDQHPYRRILLNTFRYVVILEVVADEAVILAVAHTSRRPNYWLRRK
jgi:toxin ParE1/3/4